MKYNIILHWSKLYYKSDTKKEQQEETKRNYSEILRELSLFDASLLSPNIHTLSHTQNHSPAGCPVIILVIIDS